MKHFLRNSLRTVLVLTVVLGVTSIGFAQTKPAMKRRTTTKRVVPLVPVGTEDLHVNPEDGFLLTGKATCS